MKNPLSPAGIEPVTFRFVVQHLNHRATAVPIKMHDTNMKITSDFGSYWGKPRIAIFISKPCCWRGLFIYVCSVSSNMIDASQVVGCVSPCTVFQKQYQHLYSEWMWSRYRKRRCGNRWVWASCDIRNRVCRFSSIRAHSIISLSRQTGTHTKLEKQTRSSVGSLWWFPLSSDRVAKSCYKTTWDFGCIF